DEPFKTKDSNTFGPASLGLVEAKVKYILWPLERFGPVPSTPPDTSLLSRIMPAPPHIKDINELMRASRVRTRQESESASDAEWSSTVISFRQQGQRGRETAPTSLAWLSLPTSTKISDWDA
ncbi:hypothetical protein FRB93_010331, partial [Tulasnella sp. JGI-2019a]